MAVICQKRLLRLFIASVICLFCIYSIIYQLSYHPSQKTASINSFLLQSELSAKNLTIHQISAFYDPRSQPFVTVMAVINKEAIKLPIFCKFFTENEEIMYTVKLKKVPIPIADWEMNFVGHLFLCEPTSGHGNSSPSSVLVAFDKMTAVRPVRILTIPKHPPKKHKIVACMAPLFGSRYDAPHVVTWIELNRILGVDHFIFYNHSISPELEPVFRHYVNNGIVTALPWQLEGIPFDKSGQFPPAKNVLHYYGQLEAMNDCLYRYTNRYYYIMFIDLDEIIFPYKFKRIDDFLESVTAKSWRDVAEVIFWMNYLRGDLPKEPTTRDNPFVKKHHVVFFERTSLENRVIYNMKQKAIVIGEKLKRMSVHRRVEFWKNSVTHFVDVGSARLLHYTEPPKSLLKKNLGGWRDERLLRYFKPLLNSTEAVFKKVAFHKGFHN